MRSSALPLCDHRPAVNVADRAESQGPAQGVRHVDGHEGRVAAAAFEPEPTAVAAARRFVRETLNSWQLSGRDDLVADAVLLTSELVTNALVHAGTSIQLTCRLDDAAVEVSVLDRHPARMIPDPPSGSAEADRPGGRGLLLPGALSSSWGVTYAPTAKVVWFRLGLDAQSDRAPAADEALAAAGRPNGFTPGEYSSPAGIRRGADRLQGGYQELLGQAVELAGAEVAADAVYALVADEDGELRIGAAAEHGAVQAAPATAGTKADLAEVGTFLTSYDQLAGRGADLAQAQRDSGRSLMTVPILAEGRVTGVLAVVAAEPGRFTDADLARVQHIADRVAVPLERARLSEHERARRGRMSFVAEASDLLAGTLDEDQTIALAAQLAVPRLATWCAVLLPDESGQLELAYTWHADESRADALATLLNHSPPPPQILPGDGAQVWTLAGAKPELHTAMTAELVSDSAWCFPLLARDRSPGVFVIGRPRGGAMARDALDLAEDLSRRAALALDNARLYSEQLQATRALQRSLLPPELPDIPGVDLAAAYEAAGKRNEVGGDFYDMFEVAGGRWRFTIGDVCGKGPEAAAVTGLTRHALRILAREDHNVPAVLERLNALIVGEGPRAPFITLIHGELIPAPGRAATISLACAGHPPPLILRADGEVEAGARPQPLLGVLDQVAFRTDTIRISPGDVLLCFTDGVTERRASGRLLDDDDGLSQLLGECSGLNAGAIVARIQRAVHEFGTGPPADDLALIVFRGL
jgi:serine phosphatase RsbU (regulator of sigma subunit)/anti-sigma regulatory factor (Ser/Thr protein kinase)